MEEKSKSSLGKKWKKVVHIGWPVRENNKFVLPVTTEQFKPEKLLCTPEVFKEVQKKSMDKRKYAHFMLYTDGDSKCVSNIEILPLMVPGEKQIVSSSEGHLLRFLVVAGELQVMTQPMGMGSKTVDAIKKDLHKIGLDSVRYGMDVGARHRISQVLDDQEGFRIFVSDR